MTAERFTVKLVTRLGVDIAEVVLDDDRQFATYRQNLATDPDFHLKAAALKAEQLNDRFAVEGKWWCDHKDTPNSFWERMELLGHVRS